MISEVSERPSRAAGIYSLGFTIDESNLSIRREQLRTRMAAYPFLVLTQLALIPLFGWLFWEHAKHETLLIWAAISYPLHLLELLYWMRHKNRLDTVADCFRWHLFFTVLALTTGSIWGTVAIAVFPDGMTEQSILICIMLGLTAGAITINPVHPPALYGYVLGIMLPLTTRMLLVGDSDHTILGIMLMLFTGVLLVSGWGLHRTFMLTLRQQFERQQLLGQLSAQKEETEAARDLLAKANVELKEHEQHLERLVAERTSELQQKTEEVGAIKDVIIVALSSLAEARDQETGQHIHRTQHYIKLLAEYLKEHPRFREFLTDANIDLLYKLAPLHDIGKVAIPDHILRKPGRLTSEEYEIMKQHTILGGNAITIAEHDVKAPHNFLNIARQIAVGHHEKWNGQGYPHGLRGDDIPIPARLMALADVYDALISRRVYKMSMDHQIAAELILQESGAHFDPDVVTAFSALREQFREIAETYQDVSDSNPSLLMV